MSAPAKDAADSVLTAWRAADSLRDELRAEVSRARRIATELADERRARAEAEEQRDSALDRVREYEAALDHETAIGNALGRASLIIGKPALCALLASGLQVVEAEELRQLDERLRRERERSEALRAEGEAVARQACERHDEAATLRHGLEKAQRDVERVRKALGAADGWGTEEYARALVGALERERLAVSLDTSHDGHLLAELVVVVEPTGAPDDGGDRVPLREALDGDDFALSDDLTRETLEIAEALGIDTGGDYDLVAEVRRLVERLGFWERSAEGGRMEEAALAACREAAHRGTNAGVRVYREHLTQYGPASGRDA